MVYQPVSLKKSLGQHFLHDENICRKIIEALQSRPFSQLLEIGPGAGALTKYLIAIPEIRFKAVELDHEKVEYLRKTYPILEGKILEADFLRIEKPFQDKFTVVGNFPYNISSQILFKLLDWKEDMECMVGMFQKELAQRAAAKEGSKVYGVLSVLVQAWFTVEYLFEVQEGSFTPPPKVKSAVIRLIPKKVPLSFLSESKFRLLVKTAFNQRRKTLRNGVRGLFPPTEMNDPIFNKRAEQLSIDDFAQLTHKMN
jgi:16S rRNA (adenine1518-N6/adenine1519-N6)-dimethyltransferase